MEQRHFLFDQFPFLLRHGDAQHDLSLSVCHVSPSFPFKAFGDFPKGLPQQEQSILILHCVLEMSDGEIGALMGMSRSAVQRHRTKTLKELRTKLMALMPEGG